MLFIVMRVFRRDGPALVALRPLLASEELVFVQRFLGSSAIRSVDIGS